MITFNLAPTIHADPVTAPTMYIYHPFDSLPDNAACYPDLHDIAARMADADATTGRVRFGTPLFWEFRNLSAEQTDRLSWFLSGARYQRSQMVETDQMGDTPPGEPVVTVGQCIAIAIVAMMAILLVTCILFGLALLNQANAPSSFIGGGVI